MAQQVWAAPKCAEVSLCSLGAAQTPRAEELLLTELRVFPHMGTELEAFCLPCKGPTTSNISMRHQVRGKAGLLMLSFLPTALCLMLTPDQHYLPFLIPAVPHDVTGCQGELGTASLGFGINSKHRRTTEAQGHLHHVNTQAKCVLNMPRTQALLIHIKTKNLAVVNAKTRMMCTFPPKFQLKRGSRYWDSPPVKDQRTG